MPPIEYSFLFTWHHGGSGSDKKRGIGVNQQAFSIVLPAKSMLIALITLSVLPLLVPAQGSESVNVTIYRPPASFKGNTIFSCDHNKYKIALYHNGQKILRIHKGHFVTLRLPVGHHAFKSTRSKTLEIDLKVAGQYFIRPRQTCGGAFLAQEAVELVVCEEATTEAQQLVPLDAEDIYIQKNLVGSLRPFSGVCKARPVF